MEVYTRTVFYKVQRQESECTSLVFGRRAGRLGGGGGRGGGGGGVGGGGGGGGGGGVAVAVAVAVAQKCDYIHPSVR